MASTPTEKGDGLNKFAWLHLFITSAGTDRNLIPDPSRFVSPDVSGWRPPGLQCVLLGEKEVKCSWEVSADVSQVITHQLLCRRNHTGP